MRTAGGGGGTGVPGNPGAVRAGGETVAAAGTAINDTAQAIQNSGTEAAVLWSGSAAEAFEAATRALGAGTYAGGDVCELVERVLSAYAEDLEAAQQDWAAAHADLSAAQSAERAARASDPGDDPDRRDRRDRDIRRAATDAADARTDMADAQQRALEANTKAAGKIDGFTGDLADMKVARVVTAPADSGGISSVGHLTLDLIGLFPGFGEPADLTNAVWYAAEGNTVDAALSLGSTVPLVGGIPTIVKFGDRGLDAARAADNATDAARDAERLRNAPREGASPGGGGSSPPPGGGGGGSSPPPAGGGGPPNGNRGPVSNGAINVANGAAAELRVADFLGVPRNVGPGRVTYTMPNGQVRIPDIDPRLTPGELVEVKFSRGPDKLYISDQLRDLVAEARRTGVKPVLYTNRPTAGTLEDLDIRGIIDVRPIP